MFFDEIAKRESCGLISSNGEHAELMGLRISSVFVVLVGSGFGVFFPILASRYSFVRMPSWVFFFCKYFGSGVIISTAFIHLLFEANENLTSECLSNAWQNYPYAFGIMLGTLFALFLAEIMSFRFVESKLAGLDNHGHSHFGDESVYVERPGEFDDEISLVTLESADPGLLAEKYPPRIIDVPDLDEKGTLDTPNDNQDKEQYFGQLVSIFVLEFGVLFHSVFVGLTLGITSTQFTTLYIVIIFHQLFEGLGLGSRIAATIWPKGKHWIPWVFAAGFTLVTPIGIAIGLGVSGTYPSDSPRALITNGVFDSISAGILIYSGLVELMAHEFLFSTEFKGAGGTKRMLWAYGCMCLGCGLMSLLGRWA
ncbi:ZIP zinc/iron transport family [Metschnikowia bicuspidata var. bicuspidata NRRL YB-4993]|uniref:ZIP zinc/iron transport family n=1 Tax=Metschnikowia bicuspidata var. bicuspidata NRRL YB-4993 TaxID=869754 RepID=A0A1A0HF34_9ASCO|nr:ZIP zinc/iron transport family [Metschnikowia bicuspidata var. bicuspidata NRRL YB-4993]OBA22498.1 ZIP zinc/iron transport family [Metschnikowia bicuspidata var. bicuspidata NRRL YB-4993]